MNSICSSVITLVKNPKNLLPEKGRKRLLFLALLSLLVLPLLLMTIFLLPLAVGSALAWYGSKQLENKSLHFAATAGVIFLALFLNIKWIRAFGGSDSPQNQPPPSKVLGIKI